MKWILTNLLVAITFVPGFVSANGAAPIVIPLSPETIVHSRDVNLLDVIVDGHSDARSQILFRDIDIGVIRDHEVGVAIRRSFLKIRLLLAGWKESDFDLVGPETVFVRYQAPPPLTDTEVEAAALETFLAGKELTADAVRIRLNRPLMATLSRTAQQSTDARIEVLPPLRSGLGVITMTVRLWEGDKLIASRPTRFDVSRRQRVAVLRVSRNRGDLLRTSDLQFENQFLDHVTDEPREEDVIGKRLRTAMKAGETISLRDLDEPVPETRKQVIASRDKVFVTAICGPLRVKFSHAEAIQAGRVGDVISIRNLDSQKVISARVIGPGEVEIRLR